MNVGGKKLCSKISLSTLFTVMISIFRTAIMALLFCIYRSVVPNWQIVPYIRTSLNVIRSILGFVSVKASNYGSSFLHLENRFGWHSVQDVHESRYQIHKYRRKETVIGFVTLRAKPVGGGLRTLSTLSLWMWVLC